MSIRCAAGLRFPQSVDKKFPEIVSAIGSAMATGLFVATISFLFTTPGVTEASAGGFPALSMTGEFVIKDIAPLGLSVWTLADAVNAVRARTSRVQK